jgi:hypothetical protein
MKSRFALNLTIVSAAVPEKGAGARRIAFPQNIVTARGGREGSGAGRMPPSAREAEPVFATARARGCTAVLLRCRSLDGPPLVAVSSGELRRTSVTALLVVW